MPENETNKLLDKRALLAIKKALDDSTSTLEAKIGAKSDLIEIVDLTVLEND